MALCESKDAFEIYIYIYTFIPLYILYDDLNAI